MYMQWVCPFFPTAVRKDGCVDSSLHQRQEEVHSYTKLVMHISQAVEIPAEKQGLGLYKHQSVMQWTKETCIYPALLILSTGKIT